MRAFPLTLHFITSDYTTLHLHNHHSSLKSISHPSIQHRRAFCETLTLGNFDAFASAGGYLYFSYLFFLLFSSTCKSRALGYSYIQKEGSHPFLLQRSSRAWSLFCEKKKNEQKGT